MKVSDVLKKVAAGEELSDAEKAFLESYEEPDVDAVANARSKKERLKLEKKLEDMKAELAAKDEELEASVAGGSELEKLQKQVEKLTARMESSTAELEAERTAHAETKRNTAINSLSAKVPWVDGVSDRYKATVMAEAFDGIDTEDLSDDKTVSARLAQIKEQNARFIASDVAKGAGTGGEKHVDADGNSGPVNIPKSGEWKTMAQSKGMDAVRSKVKDIWKSDAPAA